jgi:hypothetical protein
LGGNLGGIIYLYLNNNDETYTITKCLFNDSIATKGGAIYAAGAYLDIIDSIFSNNTAGDHGGNDVYFENISPAIRAKYLELISSTGWIDTCSSSAKIQIISNSGDIYDDLIKEWCPSEIYFVKNEASFDNNLQDCIDSSTPCNNFTYVLSSEDDFMNIYIHDGNITNPLFSVIEKSVLIKSNDDSIYYFITPYGILKKPFINISNSYLKLRQLGFIILQNFNTAIINLNDGKLLMTDVLFKPKLDIGVTITSSVILQESGSTTIEKKDSTADHIFGLMFKNKGFAEVNGGSFRVTGISVNNLNHDASSEQPQSLFLLANGGGQVDVGSVEFQEVTITTCQYIRPKVDGEDLKGGIIAVIGSVGSSTRLVLKEVKFENIKNKGSDKNSGGVKGGAVYGIYLDFVTILTSTFTACSASQGSGGAIYIDEVKSDIIHESFVKIVVYIKKKRLIYF